MPHSGFPSLAPFKGEGQWQRLFTRQCRIGENGIRRGSLDGINGNLAAFPRKQPGSGESGGVKDGRRSFSPCFLPGKIVFHKLGSACEKGDGKGGIFTL